MQLVGRKFTRRDAVDEKQQVTELGGFPKQDRLERHLSEEVREVHFGPHLQGFGWPTGFFTRGPGSLGPKGWMDVQPMANSRSRRMKYFMVSTPI